MSLEEIACAQRMMIRVRGAKVVECVPLSHLQIMENCTLTKEITSKNYSTILLKCVVPTVAESSVRES